MGVNSDPFNRNTVNMKLVKRIGFQMSVGSDEVSSGNK